MSCFQFRDALATAQPHVPTEGLGDHLRDCPACTERQGRQLQILRLIADLPRAPLPETLPERERSKLADAPRQALATLARAHWERVPWYLRTTLEGGTIILLVLLGISAGPRIRAFYERNAEHSLTEYSEALNDPSQAPDAETTAPADRGQPAGSPLAATAGAAVDDFAGGEGGDAGAAEADEGDEEEVVAGGETIHVGNSEIWRFNLRTDSPHEFRARVTQVLRQVKVPPQEGVSGILVPGGIQFNLLVPKGLVAELKTELQKIAPAAPATASDRHDPLMGDTFTWYKNRSRTPIPAGKTRVVIWLSQI